MIHLRFKFIDAFVNQRGDTGYTSSNHRLQMLQEQEFTVNKDDIFCKTKIILKGNKNQNLEPNL